MRLMDDGKHPELTLLMRDQVNARLGVDRSYMVTGIEIASITEPRLGDAMGILKVGAMELAPGIPQHTFALMVEPKSMAQLAANLSAFVIENDWSADLFNTLFARVMNQKR